MQQRLTRKVRSTGRTTRRAPIPSLCGQHPPALQSITSATPPLILRLGLLSTLALRRDLAFEAGLYVGSTPSAVTTAILSGSPVATSAMQAGGGWDYSGTETATVPFAPGANVYVAIAAWSTTTGNPTSYATALAAGDNVGYSIVSTSTLEVGGTPSVGTPIIPSTLTGSGITDFTVGPVPEPSTIALGVMGASAFLMRLRRK